MIIELNPNQVAGHIARLLQVSAVESTRFRRDVGNVQIDKIKVSELQGDYQALQFSFEMDNHTGVELRVRLDEFAADPRGYLAGLFQNLQEMRHATMQRRAGSNAITDSVRMAIGV